MKSGNFLVVIGFAAFLAGTLITGPPPVLAQTGNARTGAPGDRFEDVDGDGYNDAVPKKDAASRKKVRNEPAKRFVDEDGDGINDLAPAAGAKESASESAGRKTNKTAATGDGNTLENGAGNTGNRGAGLGLKGVLERGRKMGQSETDETINGGNRGQNNNSKNRFGREYIFNNEKNHNNGNNGNKSPDGTKK